MDFLDIFENNEENIEDIVVTTSEIDLSRKRKLDNFLTAFINEAEDIIEKKPKLSTISFTNPLDNIVYKSILKKNCKHELFYPKSITYKPLKPRLKNPAKEFKFSLDEFQLQAIQCIENNQSLLVSAHTSAGKTVCASYAIAQCLREKRRVIYTTPIKALSNQKYRDFKEEFEDVGLLTGDVTIDANASLLIMTTEILLLMIYRNSSIIKEVGWVIYDEVHYMRDRHRGVVWEQSIILMPSEIRMAFLSATIPNSNEFGQWIAHVRSQPCNVIYTNSRPTPLKHYIYPNGADCIYQIVNENGDFNEEKFEEAMIILRKAGDNAKSDLSKLGRKGGSTSVGTHCEKLIKKVFELNNDPAIVFSFSKSSCDTYSRLFGKLNYTNKLVIENIKLIFENARRTLPEEDRKLPQLDTMLNLVKRGIGVHHSGLLPVLKEVVEILFSEGLTKCLYATETFSMGLNMPAKTVIFTDVVKFDGETKRLLKSGEYIQMAGRAGRRGIDDNGNVILMLDRTINRADARQLIMGEAEPLNSSFHLTYNMILNMIRAGSVTPEYLIERSFLQFQTYAELPNLRRKLEESDAELSKIEMSVEELRELSTFNRLETSISAVNEQIWSLLRSEKKYRLFIVPGRLVHIKCADRDFGWCVAMSKIGSLSATSLFAEFLVPVNNDSLSGKDFSEVFPPHRNELKPEAVLLRVSLEYCLELSSVVIQKAEDIIGSLRTNNDARREYLNKRNSVIAKFNEIPLLDSKELEVKPKFVAEFEKKKKDIQNQLLSLKRQSPERLSLYRRKMELESTVQQLTSDIERRASIISMGDLKSRKRILQRLGFLTESGVLTTKGRVACEISTGESLILTETLLSGSLSSLTDEQMLGLLSCFVFEEDARDAPPPQKDLTDSIENVKQLARHISRVSKECRLVVPDEETSAASVRTGMVEVVRKWAMGAPFQAVTEDCRSAIYDGSVIRCVRRLDELLGQLSEATRVIANVDLECKFRRASKLIRRGVIFSSSLYLADEGGRTL